MNQMGRMNLSTVKRGKQYEYQHTPILQCHCTYPEFSSREHPASASRMNVYYRSMARRFAQTCNQTLYPLAVADYRNSVANDMPVHQYEADRSFTATYNKNCAVSLYTDQYEFTGGAHGSTTRSSETWRINRGTRLRLSELFPGNRRYALELKAEIRRQIAGQLKENEGMYFEDYPKLVEETFHPEQFYLTGEGLAVYFQQYDIAPYVTGIPVFIIPYETLNMRLPRC